MWKLEYRFLNLDLECGTPWECAVSCCGTAARPQSGISWSESNAIQTLPSHPDPVQLPRTFRCPATGQDRGAPATGHQRELAGYPKRHPGAGCGQPGFADRGGNARRWRVPGAPPDDGVRLDGCSEGWPVQPGRQAALHQSGCPYLVCQRGEGPRRRTRSTGRFGDLADIPIKPGSSRRPSGSTRLESTAERA